MKKSKLKLAIDAPPSEIVDKDLSLPDDTPVEKKSKRGRPSGSKTRTEGKPVLGELVVEGVGAVTSTLCGDNEKLSLGETKLLRKVGDSYEQWSGFEVGESMGKHGLWVLAGLAALIIANHFFLARRRTLAESYAVEAPQINE